jgi:cold shock CspA family protein
MDVRISAVDMFVDSTLRYGIEVQMTVTEDRKI